MEKSRMKRAAVHRMESSGFHQVHVYQPESLFVRNGRKLSRVAEPCDPWLMFATKGDRCYNRVGVDPMAAAEAIIAATSPGVTGAMIRLGDEMDRLAWSMKVEAARAC